MSLCSLSSVYHIAGVAYKAFIYQVQVYDYI